MLSTFDDLISIHTQEANTQITQEPISCTSVCRSLIRCKWETYLASRMTDYYTKLDRFHFKNPVSNALTWFHTWDIAWRADIFRRLTFAKLGIEDAVSKDISANLKALGVGHSDTALSQDETVEWKNLQSSGTALANKYANLIDAYLQEVTIQESRTSNHQARSVGRLTALATVLVPISIITGMFSMGEEFLAGKSQFWVFWIVVIPFEVALGTIVFSRVLQTSWRLSISSCGECIRWTQEGMCFRILFSVSSPSLLKS